MEKIVCPECGALNFEGFLTYPVCHQCHENLTKCGYCRHFPGEARPCGRFDPDSSVNFTSVRPCGQFERVQTNRSANAGAPPLRAAVWASVLTCTMFGLLIVTASVLSPTAEEPSVTVSAQFPPTARVGESFSALLTIRNEAYERSEHLKIRAANELFRCFRCEGVSPSGDPFISGNFRYYHLPKLPPQKTLKVTVVLAPLTDGEHTLTFQVLSWTNVLQDSDVSRLIHVFPGSSPEATARVLEPLNRSAPTRPHPAVTPAAGSGAPLTVPPSPVTEWPTANSAEPS